MSRIIAVLGSTGQQGGAVARACLEDGDWHVRGVTRNVNSKGAQALAAAGAELVLADLNDEESLIRAFEVCPAKPNHRTTALTTKGRLRNFLRYRLLATSRPRC